MTKVRRSRVPIGPEDRMRLFSLRCNVQFQSNAVYEQGLVKLWRTRSWPVRISEQYPLSSHLG